MQPMSSVTDLSLLRRVQQHDPESWRQFVELYGPLVFAWARRLGMSEHDAADVTQETMLSVSRAIQGFTSNRDNSSLRGWLWTIVRNKTRDAQRRLREADQTVDAAHEQLRLATIPENKPDDSDPDESREVVRLLHRGLAQVKAGVEPNTWEAFWLVVVEGLSTDEVAGRLEMSPNHVRQCRSRILRRLRDLLGETP